MSVETIEARLDPHMPWLRVRLIPIDTSLPEEQEDILSDCLGVIFPDDITNQHGDAQNSVIYASPLFGDVLLTLADPQGEGSRRLCSHYLWNAALELAMLIEEGAPTSGTAKEVDWAVQGERVLELGAGTGLVGIMAAYMGAAEVVLSDYPAREVLENLQGNVTRNVEARREKQKAQVKGSMTGSSSAAGASPIAKSSPPQLDVKMNAVSVAGHEWGVLTDSFSITNANSFTRILVADCLWMPWEHHNLLLTISHFLAPSASARAWVVAGFHSGREKMRGFFDASLLARDGVNLEVERIWERNAEGVERPWAWDRGNEDVKSLKKWLVIAVLKRRDEEKE